MSRTRYRTSLTRYTKVEYMNIDFRKYEKRPLNTSHTRYIKIEYINIEYRTYEQREDVAHRVKAYRMYEYYRISNTRVAIIEH